MSETGVLLTAFGGPRRMEYVEPFLAQVLGRQPTAEEVETERLHYLTVGGASPAVYLAERLAAQLERHLSGVALALPASEQEEGLTGFGMGEPLSPRMEEKAAIPVAAGLLHGGFDIHDGVAALKAVGCGRVVWISLMPLRPAARMAQERALVVEACAAEGVELLETGDYITSSDYIDAVASGYSVVSAEGHATNEETLTLFVAPGLPREDPDDTLVARSREAALKLADRLMMSGITEADTLAKTPGYSGSMLPARWLLTYMPAYGETGTWPGPSVVEAIDAAADAGFRRVLLCPLGLINDSIETIHYLDVEVAGRIFDRDMDFGRAYAPSDSDPMIEALGALVDTAIGQADERGPAS